MLEQVHLGKTDVLVPPLGIGTWAWGDRLVWNYGSGYGEKDIREAFDVSLNAGIDFFDTAEIYGNGQSERFLGTFIRASGKPVTLATKFMPYPWRLSRKELIHSLHNSLERLGVDRVDLYQIHMPMPPVPIETWMDVLADAVEQGLARAVGVSNYNAVQVRRAYEALAKRNIPLATNQIEYSLLHRQPERNGVLATCREYDVSVIAYSPIAKGLLTGKYTPDHRPRGLRGWRMGGINLARIQPLVQRMREIGAESGGKTPSQVALNWLICKNTIPIPGAKNARQAEEDVGGLVVLPHPSTGSGSAQDKGTGNSGPALGRSPEQSAGPAKVWSPSTAGGSSRPPAQIKDSWRLTPAQVAELDMLSEQVTMKL